ncbi:hypothetical protein [Nonomuraea sp. SYSU D8015]|uniref:hypothetical protein n=1 Tax=Nonomuraea sp. SYSU D8015 TaxID=2593644 RepID=UPI0016608842|nr:hypothetical protein [Nonomuraea sp. SYSU D8015]
MPKFKTIAALAVITATGGAFSALTTSSTANAAAASPVTSMANGFVTGHGWGDYNRHRHKVRIWIHNNNTQHQNQRTKQDQDQDQDQDQSKSPLGNFFNDEEDKEKEED